VVKKVTRVVTFEDYKCWVFRVGPDFLCTLLIAEKHRMRGKGRIKGRIKGRLKRKITLGMTLVLASMFQR
jgi:hypothetical protein